MSTAAARKVFTPTPEQKKELEGWLTYYPYPIMGLLEAMRSVQTWFRCIPPEAEVYLAELFKTSVSHIHQVATFFPTFTQKPAGKHRVGICHGLSCAMQGSDKIAKCLEKTLGVRERVTTADGNFSWEEMECIGACEFAPALLVDEHLKGKATEESVAKLAKDLK
jgi:NADH-quinone oxidoreductase subunit E